MLNTNEKIINGELLDKLNQVRELESQREAIVNTIRSSLPTTKNSLFSGTKQLTEKQFNKNLENAVLSNKEIRKIDKEIKKLEKNGKIRAFKCTYKLRGFDEVFSLILCCNFKNNTSPVAQYRHHG